VVGQATTTGGYIYHAFLYSQGTMLDLDVTGQSWSSANAINHQGQIVGEMTTSNGAIHAFLYTNGAMMDLGTLPSGNYSSAKGINDLGVIVGESSQYIGGAMNTYAFVCSNGVMSNLGTLGGNYSSAHGVNHAGQIVGEANTANGETHAFLYQDGLMSDLGTLGGTNSTAAGINNRGQVVGYALTANQGAHAFLFTGTTMFDLNGAFSLAVGWSNVFLTLAYAINDAGQITGGVNWYTNSSAGTFTNYHAFILTPQVWLASPTMLTDGQFVLTAVGSFGQRIVIQGSPDLANWTPLSTNVLGTGPLQWVDTNAPSSTGRFYRALLLP
jgi:probable HAF family extracellular repeat protein